MAKKSKTSARKATTKQAAKAARGFAPTARITVKAGAENPCREGSVHHKGFEFMRKAGTVDGFRKFKTTDSEPHVKILRNAVAKGYAKVG